MSKTCEKTAKQLTKKEKPRKKTRDIGKKKKDREKKMNKQQ